MKILIVNSYDSHGGAARAAYRLHTALQDAGIDSQMIVQKKFGNDDKIIVCQDEWNGKASFYDKMPLLGYPKKTSTLFSIAAVQNNSLIKFINSSNFDIVHLHWIANAYLSIEDIAKIKKPIIWSLHDNWAFTGGCHIMWECEKYKVECGFCPRLGSNNEHDLSRKVFERKRKFFMLKQDMTIVGLSRWINDCSKQSTLLKDKEHANLPNLLDTTIFKPYDTATSRELWGLSKKKKLILFGAMSAISDVNKGFDELSKALHKLRFKDIELVVFGTSDPKNAPDLGFKTHYIRQLNDDVSLAILYSAVDVMVVPSKQEAFGQTASEAMSCCTPVVAFGHTGLLDIVDHLQNGYLAQPFDIDDLAKGIEWILYESDYTQLCKNAREKVTREFDSKVVVAKYIKLYEKIIENCKRDSMFLFRPDNSLKLITKEIEDWFFTLASKDYTYVIYGYGSFAHGMMDYFSKNIIAFVDQKSDLISHEIIKGEVYSPANLPNMNYDKIIISVLGREDEIEKYLINELSVPKEKIVRLVI